MNRPLKRKLAIALLAYLDAHKTGTPFATLTLVTGASTTLAQEIAFDAGGAPGAVTEPELPYLACEVVTQADPDLPGVVMFEALLHLKTLAAVEDGEGEPAARAETDAMLRAIYDRLMTPPDDAQPFSDINKECAAFLTFANKPTGTDTRETFRKPLHVYGMWHTAAPSLFDTDIWHDQLLFAGHAQDMNAA